MGNRSSRPRRRSRPRPNPCCSSRNHYRRLSNSHRHQSNRNRELANRYSRTIRQLQNKIRNQKGTVNFYRNRVNRFQRELNNAARNRRKLEADMGKITAKFYLLKKTTLDNSSSKKKAKEVFSMLENQLLSKYKLIKTQQNLMNKQNSILSREKELSEKNMVGSGKKAAALHTSKRQLHYDEKEYGKLNYMYKIFKLILVLISALVIFFIYKKNLSNN
jgi:hypothetical protein